MADAGAVYASVKLDDRDAIKKLDQLKDKIVKLKNDLERKRSERSGIEEQMDKAEAQTERTRQKVLQLQEALAKASVSERAGIRAQLATETAEYKEQTKQMDALNKQWQKLDKQITEGDDDLKRMENQAAGLARQVAASESALSKVRKAASVAEEKIGGVFKRLSKSFERIFFYSLAFKALRAVRDYFGAYLQSIPEVSAALGQLKGALLTMAQPIMSAVVPALVTLLNLLVRVAQVAAQVIAMIFGTTAQAASQSAEAIYDQQKALTGTGKAAKKAAKDLAAFDEINRLTSGSSGSGGGAGVITPTFDMGEQLMQEQLKRILDLVELIGAALAAWKIGSALGLGLKETAGLFAAIYSEIQFLESFFDAWVNGVSWDKLRDQLIWMLGAAAGLWAAFGKTGAAIGLIVDGLLLMAEGFHDAMENGWNLVTLLTTIAGLLTAGIGISILTGSWIPLLIAGIASVLLAFTVATGHGEELLNGIQTMMEGFLDFFRSIFVGDIDGAVLAIYEIFSGLKTALLAIINGLQDTILSFLDWLDEKTNGRLHGIIVGIKEFFIGQFDNIKTFLSNFINAVRTLFVGLTEFIAGVFTGDWERAWTGVKDIFRGIFNGLISIYEGGINAIIRGLNWLIQQMNKIQFTVPDWVPEVGGRSIGIHISPISEFKIPRLAQGAVIPPNREFLAVLGDQKSGTNIEAPLATIVAAMREALSDFDGSGTVTIPVYLDGDLIARYVIDRINRSAVASGRGDRI